MKKWKYGWLLALILALAVTFVGCGSGEEDVAGKVEPNDGVTEANAGGTLEEETEAPTETPAEENPVSLGRMEGGIYTNGYVGFGCELDANWTFYSAEELQDLPENVADLMAGTELGDAASQVQQITDMMAENVNDLTSMNVLYQKLSMQERISYAVMDDEAILDATLAMSDDMIAAYAQAGIEVESFEKVPVTFLGEERVALHTTAQIQDVPYFTLQIFDYHLGQYAVTTTFSSYVEDNTESLLDLFYKVG